MVLTQIRKIKLAHVAYFDVAYFDELSKSSKIPIWTALREIDIKL